MAEKISSIAQNNIFAFDVLAPCLIGAFLFGVLLLGAGPTDFTGDEGAQLAATAYFQKNGNSLAYPYGASVTNAFPVLGSFRLLTTALAALVFDNYSTNLFALGAITVVSYFTSYSALLLIPSTPRWCAHTGAFLFTFSLQAFTRNPDHFNVWTPYSIALTYAGIWLANKKPKASAEQILAIGIGIGSGSHYYAIPSLILFLSTSIANLARPNNNSRTSHIISAIKPGFLLSSGIVLGLSPAIIAYRIALQKIPDFQALARGVGDQYQYGLSIYRLFVPPEDLPLFPGHIISKLNSGDITQGVENLDVFLGYFGIAGLLYLIYLSFYGEQWARQSLTISVATLLFCTKGGFGHIFHAGITDAIRAQARLSQYVYFSGISGYCAGLGRIARNWNPVSPRLKKLSSLFLAIVTAFLYDASLPRSRGIAANYNASIKQANHLLSRRATGGILSSRFYDLTSLKSLQGASKKPLQILFIPTYQHPGTAEKVDAIDISYLQTKATLEANPDSHKTTAALTDLWLIRDLGATSPLLAAIDNSFKTDHIRQIDLLTRWCSLDFDAIVDNAHVSHHNKDIGLLSSSLPSQIMSNGLALRNLSSACFELKRKSFPRYSVSATKGWSDIEISAKQGAGKGSSWQWATSRYSFLRVYALEPMNSLSIFLHLPSQRPLDYSINGGQYQRLPAKPGIHRYKLIGQIKKGINTIKIISPFGPIKAPKGETRSLFYQYYADEPDK